MIVDGKLAVVVRTNEKIPSEQIWCGAGAYDFLQELMLNHQVVSEKVLALDKYVKTTDGFTTGLDILTSVKAILNGASHGNH